MADLMRMLETYSRRAKQEEDKISATTQQEEMLRNELETARTINNVKKQELLDAQAKCGELTSELQQKTATLEACKAANTSTKEEISTAQQQRHQLQLHLQSMQESFVASCAQLDTEAHVLLEQLQASAANGGFQDCRMSLDDLGDAHGSKLAAAMTAAAAPGAAFMGLGGAESVQDACQAVDGPGSGGLLL